MSEDVADIKFRGIKSLTPKLVSIFKKFYHHRKEDSTLLNYKTRWLILFKETRFSKCTLWSTLTFQDVLHATLRRSLLR
jgi:hypothetical protein